MKMTAAIAAAILAFCSCTSAAYLPVNATQGSVLTAEGAHSEKLATKLTTPGTADEGDLSAATLADKSKEPKINMAPISYSAEEVLFTQGKACTKWSAEQWAGDEKKGFPKRSAIPVCRHWEYDESRTAPYYVMRGSMMWNKECLMDWSVDVDGQYVAVKCGKHTASDPLPGVARVLFKELQGSELEVPGPNDPVVLDDTGDHLGPLRPLSSRDVIHQVQRRGRGGAHDIMHDEPLPTAVRPSEVGLEDPGHHLPIWPVLPNGDNEHGGVQQRGVGGPGNRGPLLVGEDLCSAKYNPDPAMMSKTLKTYCEACLAGPGQEAWQYMQDCSKLYDQVMEERPLKWYSSQPEKSEDRATRITPVAPKPSPSTISMPVMKKFITKDAETCTFSDEDMSGARADFCKSGCKTWGKQGIRCEKLAVQVKAEDEHGIFLPAFDGMPKLNSVMRGNKIKCAKFCLRTADYPATAWDGWCRTRCNGLTYVD